MSLHLTPDLSQPVLLVRLAVLLTGLAVTAIATAADDQPAKSIGRIFVRGLYIGAAPGAKPEGIVSLDPETGQVEATYPISTPGEPSPDGRRIVYVRSGGNLARDQVGIWVYEAGGEAPGRRIFDQPGEPSAWTDQGRSVIVVVNVKDDQWETWRVAADGTKQVKLPVPQNLVVLDAGPDGSWLAAREVGDTGHWGRLTLIHPDGTGAHHLTEGSPRRDIFAIPRFSPDGREIAVSEVQTIDGVRTSRLYLMDLDGKHRRELPVKLDRGATAVPVWSPDGSRLAIGLIARQTSAIVVIDRSGKDMRTLPLPPRDWFFTLCGWSR